MKKMSSKPMAISVDRGIARVLAHHRRQLAAVLIYFFVAWMPAAAQSFFNLTADEVRIGTQLPLFTHAIALGEGYADSVYVVSIKYPEFIDMSQADAERVAQLCPELLPEMPVIDQYVGVSRKRGTLYLSFVPVVLRDGKLQKLVSFMLDVQALPRSAQHARRRADGGSKPAERYADHSVLATGRWAKIRVAETGIYQLTDAFMRSCGFSHPDRVRVYGYGGNLQPAKLEGDYLAATDDLQEVPTCTVGGRRLFRALGPVGWASDAALSRTRNNYSQYGYYFLTEAEGAPLQVDSAAFAGAFYPAPEDYHSLHEVDDYAWFHGGRNLYEKEELTVGKGRDVQLPAYSALGTLVVQLSFDGPFKATVAVNGTAVGSISATSKPDQYTMAFAQQWSFRTEALEQTNTVTITQTEGSTVRLDYISIVSNEPKAMPRLSAESFPTPEYVYGITNQDHHADTAVDMVIIIPTSQQVRAQAERLKEMHEQMDGLRVRIVPADELFNEYSSGTPDANAYRRYLKMLYDRAQSDADMPRFLLLFGDAAWDNRMLLSDWRSCSPDDFLLCYESENSFSEVYCYVSDDYFCLLDDGEGERLKDHDKIDVAVGRLTARTAEQAKTMVDKTIAYRRNDYAGAWQNTLCFMADDGNNNVHMEGAEEVLGAVLEENARFNVKKIYWDSYTRTQSSTGNSYPDVESAIRQQMRSGALIMNYSGHGAPYCISHERVLLLSDFAAATSQRLPLWITASCDIMPFDGQDENIGETAMYNKNGGAIAFFGTTRTVYSDRNKRINRAFTRRVLGYTDGRRNTLGEAAMQAKNALVTGTKDDGSDQSENHLQYTLLGDPALVLAMPTIEARIDSINGVPVGQGTQQLVAGQQATVSGCIPGYDSFDGVLTITIRDVEKEVVCKKNNVETNDNGVVFVFKDRLNTIYSGSDSIHGGRFSIRFAVPRDISFSDDAGQMLLYAVDKSKTLMANGRNESFVMVGTEDQANDGVGPAVYCYLNSPAFTNGGTVNATPFFYAELSDKDGINAAGSSIGHDIELIVDGDMTRTYNLNDAFQYSFGDFRSGTVGYSLPALAPGAHKLVFRAWDVLNNPSTAELSFYVDPKQEPSIASVSCTKNPATTSTTFIINHDRAGSQMDVVLEVYDFSGRKLWERAESGLPTDQTYTLNWDLTTSSGSRLKTGVYFYRVLVSSNGSSQASEAHKLIIIGGN